MVTCPEIAQELSTTMLTIIHPIHQHRDSHSHLFTSSIPLYCLVYHLHSARVLCPSPHEWMSSCPSRPLICQLPTTQMKLMHTLLSSSQWLNPHYNGHLPPIVSYKKSAACSFLTTAYHTIKSRSYPPASSRTFFLPGRWFSYPAVIKN